MNSVALCRLLDAVGFGGNAVTKRLPEWVYTIPFDQKRALIDGYIAADGHIRANHKNVSLTSVNRDLLEDVKALALSCGLNPAQDQQVVAARAEAAGHRGEALRALLPLLRRAAAECPRLLLGGDEDRGGRGRSRPSTSRSRARANFIANGVVAHNSKVTMKYPSIYLMGEGAHGEVLSAAFAGTGQHQDAGSKCIHVAPNTTSNVVSRSISKGRGRTSYRGHIKVLPKATNVKANVRCDALLLDEESRSDTYPYMDIENPDVTFGHEATVSKVGEDQIFYLQSRGIDEQQATALIVNGFFEPFVKELPMEYAVELNRLLALSMEGSIG